MGLLSGSVSCMRLNVVALPEEVDFEKAAFVGISPGSMLRERSGFVPFEPEGEYEVANKKWAFRVRTDKVSVDPTQLKERLAQLIKTEEEEIGPVGPRKRKKLKNLAEDELLAITPPRSKIIECYMDDRLLFIGSTSKSQVGIIIELLKKIGVSVEHKTPWLDAGLEEESSDVIEPKDPAESIYGCRFLKALIADPDFFVEPEKGSAKLVTQEGCKVSLAGAVLTDLNHYLDQGAEILSAKLLVNGMQFSFDGFSYRINGLKLEPIKAPHWTEILEERLERVQETYQMLDNKFQAAQDKLVD